MGALRWCARSKLQSPRVRGKIFTIFLETTFNRCCLVCRDPASSFLLAATGSCALPETAVCMFPCRLPGRLQVRGCSVVHQVRCDPFRKRCCSVQERLSIFFIGDSQYRSHSSPT